MTYSRLLAERNDISSSRTSIGDWEIVEDMNPYLIFGSGFLPTTAFKFSGSNSQG